jgi:hypothetical protein
MSAYYFRMVQPRRAQESSSSQRCGSVVWSSVETRAPPTPYGSRPLKLLLNLTENGISCNGFHPSVLEFCSRQRPSSFLPGPRAAATSPRPQLEASSGFFRGEKKPGWQFVRENGFRGRSFHRSATFDWRMQFGAPQREHFAARSLPHVDH